MFNALLITIIKSLLQLRYCYVSQVHACLCVRVGACACLHFPYFLIVMTAHQLCRYSDSAGAPLVRLLSSS